MLYLWTENNAQNWWVVVTEVTVASWAASWVCTADTTLIWWTIIWIVPATNQDQFVDNVTLSSSWVITVTLAANATADNVFNVAVLTATWN